MIGHELKTQQQTREHGSQYGEVARVARTPVTYMIGVGFIRKLGSCAGSKDTHMIERTKTTSPPQRKPLEDEASELLVTDRINNILVLSTLRLIKFDDICD